MAGYRTQQIHRHARGIPAPSDDLIGADKRQVGSVQVTRLVRLHI